MKINLLIWIGFTRPCILLPRQIRFPGFPYFWLTYNAFLGFDSFFRFKLCFWLTFTKAKPSKCKESCKKCNAFANCNNAILTETNGLSYFGDCQDTETSGISMKINLPIWIGFSRLCILLPRQVRFPGFPYFFGSRIMLFLVLIAFRIS